MSRLAWGSRSNNATAHGAASCSGSPAIPRNVAWDRWLCVPASRRVCPCQNTGTSLLQRSVSPSSQGGHATGHTRYVTRTATELFCCRLHLIRLTRPCAGCRAREASRILEMVACVASVSRYKKNGCRNMSEPYDSERVFLSRTARRFDCDWRQQSENLGNSSAFLLRGTCLAQRCRSRSMRLYGDRKSVV